MFLDILDGYWITGDFNPGTQVFSSAAGVEDYVANNAAAFQTWLTNGNYGFITAVLDTMVGTAGVVRLRVYDSSQLQNGQYMYVSGVTGTTEANGFVQINKIDATHIDLVGTTFINPWGGGGQVTGAQIYATGAELWAAFDLYAQLAWRTRFQAITSTGATTAIPAPIGSSVDFTAVSFLHGKLTLPKARTPRAPPLGIPVSISSNANSQPTYINLTRQDSTTIQCFIGLGDRVQVTLTDNSTANGTWITTSISRNTGLFAVRNLHGRRNVSFTTDIDWGCSQATLMSAIQQPANVHLLSSLSGSADITKVWALGDIHGRDQLAAFVAGDVIHLYQLGDNFGFAQYGLCSKQGPNNAGPLNFPFTSATAGVTFERWTYISTVILSAGPIMPNVQLSGSGVFFNNAATDGVVLTGGAATAETAVTINTKIPDQYCTKARILVSATSTNANTLSLYAQATQVYASVPVPAGARVVFELTIPMNAAVFSYLAYKWGVATGSVDITILGYHVANGDA